MPSFFELWENIVIEKSISPEETDNATSPLQDSEDESLAMAAIRNGMNLRKDDCGNFWDDFMSICGDANAMSELLDVPHEKVTGWSGKIRDMLDKVKDSDDQTDGGKNKSEMIPTGNQPAAAPNEQPGNSFGSEHRPLPS